MPREHRRSRCHPPRRLIRGLARSHSGPAKAYAVAVGQPQKSQLTLAFLCSLQASGSVSGHFHIMSDEGHQGVLLAVRQLTEALQQLALVQRQLRAVQAHAQLVTQRTFLDKALFQARDDFGVHAAVMVARYLGNALTHPVWQADDKFVSGAA